MPHDHEPEHDRHKHYGHGRHPRRGFVAAILLTVGTLPAYAAGNPFLGRWQVVNADPAPWVDPKDASTTPDFDTSLSHMTIVFNATSIEGPKPFGCKKAVYKVQTSEPDELFEGGLKHPKEDAAKLGFTSQQFPVMNEGCASSAADFDMDFAMVDHDTLVFALNNVIYRLKRIP